MRHQHRPGGAGARVRAQAFVFGASVAEADAFAGGDQASRQVAVDRFVDGMGAFHNQRLDAMGRERFGRPLPARAPFASCIRFRTKRSRSG